MTEPRQPGNAPNGSGMPEIPARREAADQPIVAPSTREVIVGAHEVIVEDRGPFTVAACTCGWYSPARRSRPLARSEAADHLRLHGLLP